MTGTVLTFYSYKGGVGRSFALANIAVLLARWGYRVLAVDWDLEAPGLHEYFAPLLNEPPTTGVVDLVDDFTKGDDPPTAGYLTPLEVDEPGSVNLIAAGRRDSDYAGRVQAIDWAELYERGFADVLERRRAEWVADHDFVLIDSRTGISETGGICTAHLPDRLVVVFTANEQNIRGVVDIAARAEAARDRMPYDRPRLTVLPVLSRLDKFEYERAEQWRRKCAELVAPLFRGWLVKSVPEDLMLRHLTLPYVSYWSFGEQLPVREERVPSADQISFALETVAAVIAHGFDRTDLLGDNRDAYVAAARGAGREFDLDILVSSPRSVLQAATNLIAELRALGLRADRSLSGDPDFLDKARDPARHLCLVVDGQVSRWQATEAERFLRHTLDAGGDRRLFPVLTATADPGRLPPFLRNLQHLELGARPKDLARKLHDTITSGEPPRPEADRQAYRDAAAALRALPAHLPYRSRWDVIEQIVQGMTDALRIGDLDSLRDLTLDLELISRVRVPGAEVEAPEQVQKLIARAFTWLDRRR
jgi:MinD-like ATPase involved in chromosome partitioning or flagellar assembly